MRRTWIEVKSVAFKRLHRVADAEDVAQDVFCRLAERGLLKLPENRGLALTAARTRAIDVYRNRALHWGKDDPRGRRPIKHRTCKGGKAHPHVFITYIKGKDRDHAEVE